MSVSPDRPAQDSGANARWGTAVIVLVVAIIAVVVGYVINGTPSPAPQPVYATPHSPSQQVPAAQPGPSPASRPGPGQ